jgi:cGMP-dependent protein kinase
MDNDFLKNLSTSQVREVIDYMELKKVPPGSYVIREGDSGKHYFSFTCPSYRLSDKSTNV